MSYSGDSHYGFRYLVLASALVASLRVVHGDKLLDYVGKLRGKRGAEIVLGKAGLAGLRGVRALLKGAKEVPTGETTRLYKKQASYEAAVEEFLSLQPVGARHFEMEEGVIGVAGRIGDRLFVLRNKSEYGYPAMDIVKVEAMHREAGRVAVGGELQRQIIYID